MVDLNTPKAFAMMTKAAESAAAAATASATRCEMKPLLKLAVPVLVASLSQAALPLTSFVYAGQLTNAAALAGLGLGVSVCNVTGVCIYYGMATGIDTLCAQAFGAGNNRLVGVAFVRGTFLTAFTFLPVALLWYNMEHALLAMGQQPSVARVTGSFSRAYLWGMVPYAVFENLKRCLQAQLIVVPEMIVALLGVLANIVFHHITMVVLGMGVYGAGLALSLTGVFMLAALIASIWCFRLGAEGCWSGIYSVDVFRRWPGYLALCIPGLSGVFLEWTSVEASCFVAGLLGEQQLASQVMLLSAYGVVFSAALSISIAANVRVGNLLGSGDAIGARKAAASALRLALCSASLVGLGLGLGRGLWPRLYGVSEGVMDMIVALAPVYATVQILDMVQFACTGILKGMGLQRIQAIAAGIAFWIVAVPTGTYLALYRGWGVRGLWSGLAFGEGPLLLFYLYTLASADWTQCAIDALQRVDNHSESSDVDTSDSDSECGGGGEAMVPGPGGGLRGDDVGGGRAGSGGGYPMKVIDAGGGRVALHEKSRLLLPV